MSAPVRPTGPERGAQPPAAPVQGLQAEAGDARSSAGRLLPAEAGDLLSPIWRHPRRVPQLGVRQWELLLAQARQSLLLPRLAQLVLDQGAVDQVPAAAWRLMSGALRWVQRQGHEARWELDTIARALAGVDTPVVVLKGAAYLSAGLPPARGRLFGDIDILVDRRQLDRAEMALLAAGWLSAERDPYNQRFYREWQHELPPLEHVTRHTLLDVHHTITAPTSAFAVDGARLIAEARPLAPGSRLAVLQPVDMVLHSAAHLFQEGEFDHGLRDLLDLDDLLLHFAAADPGFWPALLARAEALGLQVPLFHALHHVERLFGSTAPAALQPAVRALKPAGPSRAAMGWLLGRALRPMHPSCDLPGTALARELLYLRSHWLRMPLQLLLPHLARKAWMRTQPRKAPGATPA